MKGWVGVFLFLALIGASVYAFCLWQTLGGWLFEEIVAPIFLYFGWGPQKDFDFIGAVFWGILMVVVLLCLFVMPYILFSVAVFFAVRHLMHRRDKD